MQWEENEMIHSEKRKYPSDEEVVSELCMVNGVSYENIAQEGCNKSSLEIFFSGFPRMVGLSFFPRLCQLTIVGQSIKRIEGLETCPLLRELWVVQCYLTEISGLQNCVKMEKLYLYDNQISDIKNIELQVNLEVLWLNNNCIKNIQGLTTFQNLKELNLADNSIEKIGHNLDSNVSLQNLNLSGNRINSFKELAQLTHLPNLRVLTLKDPTTTPNPVCLLCNYATHVLYHLPGLQRLDTYDVSSKQIKEAAESTVMKKIMYYNMRVRTAQRNLAELHFNLLERKKPLRQLPEESIRTLTRAIKNLERELSMVLARGKMSAQKMEDKSGELTYPLEGSCDRRDPPKDISCDSAMVSKIFLKLKALRERLKVWTTRLHEIEVIYEREMAQAKRMTEYTVQFLLKELESVGNIRLEDGCSTHPWYNSCCDLLLSRFCHSDYRVYGITDIKIDRVIRIFNNALRLRFEEKLYNLHTNDDSVVSSKNHRRRLEHVYYIADLKEKSVMEEILCVLEKGFKIAEQHKAMGRESTIPLSNSLSVTEQPRIEHALRQASESSPMHKVDTVPFRHGQIIVSRLFVGNSMPIQKEDPVDRNSYPTLSSVYHNLDTHRTASSDESVSTFKTNTGSECSFKQRQWFVFDPEIVLPEYIVFFQYITADKEEPPLPKHSTEKDLSLDEKVLNMEPVLSPRPKLLSLDKTILLSVAKANVLSQITVLNLHGNSLNKIKEISCLTALKHLTISFNELRHLQDISHMPHLEFLDASYNHLVTLEGLRGLRQLKQLDVCWNKLTKAREDAAVLKKHTLALLKLDTRYNPWKKPDDVRMTILGCLTTLTHLDGVIVAEKEAADAAAMAAQSKINQAFLLAQSCTNGQRPRSLSLLSSAQLVCDLSPAQCSLRKGREPGWTAKITALNLDNRRISKLISLSELVNLRWASFNDNDISKLEGLENCVKLEELSLNNNSISTLCGLPKLRSLNKLSLDGNQLSSLDASVLEQLPNLSFLSVEDNNISSLHGIQRVRFLLELYIGNNKISTSRDIYYLKGVLNLIILDLYGNPLVETLENYRHYVVFHLPSLKALDGTSVEITESERAKDIFGGRLTSDMVAEKLGHSNYTDINFLMLQSCSIRIIDLSPPDLFTSLQSVNLEHNNLTSFSGLIYLPNIKALCLNYNHIESILPVQKTRAPPTSKQTLYSNVHSSGYGRPSQLKVNREIGPTVNQQPLMGSLEVLHLSHNGISNMANLQLSRLTNLKALFLQGNEIRQVEGLEGLHQLRELVLDGNQIKALGENSFVAQKVLLELHLAENRIRELNHLDPLTELRKLFLGMNKLQDISEINKLDILTSLTELSIDGNPVTRNSLYRPAIVLHLSQLQVLDGVMVTLEERTKADLLSDNQMPCSQCPGVSLPTTDINLPESLPLIPRNTPLRGMNITGLQRFVHGHDTPSSSMDEAPSHYTYKRKKHKHGNAALRGQTDITHRHIRRTGFSLPATGHLSDGNRVIITHHNQERDSRFPNCGKPPPV